MNCFNEILHAQLLEVSADIPKELLPEPNYDFDQEIRNYASTRITYTDDFDEKYYEAGMYLLGYYYKDKPQSVVTSWELNVIESIHNEKNPPNFLVYFRGTLPRACQGVNRKMQLMTSGDKFSPLNEDIEIEAPEVQAPRAIAFLKAARELLSSPEEPTSISTELLDLFLSGISRKDMIYHIRNFGVNNKGGEQSLDKETTCFITEPVIKNGRIRPMTKKEAQVLTEGTVDVEFAPKYSKFSPQLMKFYSDKLAEFIINLWNTFEAQSPLEIVDEDTFYGAQFLNWNKSEAKAS